MLGLMVSSGIEVSGVIFNNEKTMYDLVGGIGVEAIKGGLAALVAYGAGLGIGMFTAVAVAPLVVMAFAAVFVGIGLNWADREYNIKGQVVAALGALPDNTVQGLYQIKANAESWQEGMKNAFNHKVDEIARDFERGLRGHLCPITCRRY